MLRKRCCCNCGGKSALLQRSASRRSTSGGESVMRTVLLILILAVVVVIAALASGFVKLNQIRGAQPPTVAATHNGVTAKGGQAPAFDIETGSVKVGTSAATVKVPSLVVQKPAGNQQAAT